MKKLMKKVLVVLCSVVLLGSSDMSLIAHAQGYGEIVEEEYRELTGENVAHGVNDITGNQGAKGVILTDCVIGISVDEEGVHVSINTGATEIAKEIGAKNVYIQYKDSLGFWHNINSEPLEGHRLNDDNYAVGYRYRPAEKGVFYRAKCTHYGYLSNGYHSIDNYTDGVRYGVNN